MRVGANLPSGRIIDAGDDVVNVFVIETVRAALSRLSRDRACWCLEWKMAARMPTGEWVFVKSVDDDTVIQNRVRGEKWRYPGPGFIYVACEWVDG